MNIDNKPAPTTLHNHSNLHHHHNNLIISTSAGQQQQQQQQQQQLYSSGGSSASSGSSSPLSPPLPDVAFSRGGGGGGKPKRLKLDPKLSLDEGCAKIEPAIEEENSGVGLTTPPPNSRNNPNKRKSIDNSTNLLIPVNKSLATNSFWLCLSRDRDYEDVDQNNNSNMSQCLRIESAADNVLSCLKFSQDEMIGKKTSELRSPRRSLEAGGNRKAIRRAVIFSIVTTVV